MDSLTPEHATRSSTTALVAERYVAGALLRGADVVDEVRELLSLNDFANHGPRLLFDACCQLRDAGEQVDAASVHLHLSSEGRLGDLGPNPAGFLAELLTECPTAVGVEYHAGQVREASLLRSLAGIAAEMLRDAAEPFEPAEEMAGRFERVIAALAGGHPGGREPIKLAEALSEAVTRYDDAKAGRRAAGGVQTGFLGLDEATGGFTPGQLVIVAARPSVGKSALALQIARNAARRKVGVLVFSLEMSNAENTDRLVAATAEVSLPRLRGSVPMDADQVDRVVAETTSDGLAGLPLWLDDRAALTAEAIAATSRRMRRRQGIGLVVVDYLQLIRPADPREPRYLQVGGMARRLKELARQSGVPVVALAQLNRESENRPDGRPRLSDLRDSGEIEQHADTVLLLHRLDAAETDPTHRVDLILGKNRNGPTRTVELEFNRRLARFEERHPLP